MLCLDISLCLHVYRGRCGLKRFLIGIAWYLCDTMAHCVWLHRNSACLEVSRHFAALAAASAGEAQRTFSVRKGLQTAFPSHGKHSDNLDPIQTISNPLPTTSFANYRFIQAVLRTRLNALVAQTEWSTGSLDVFGSD